MNTVSYKKPGINKADKKAKINDDAGVNGLLSYLSHSAVK